MPAEPRAFPGSVGATGWVDPPVPSELREGHGAFASLEELQREIVTQLAAVSEPGVQVSVGLLAPLGETEAIAYAFVSGVGDDAIAGEEYRYELRRGPDGWFMVSAQQRTHCRRGVTDDLCV